jgi:hypothetical protein
MMDYLFLHINYVAVVLAGVLYWLVGMLWFPLLFGRIWAQELAKIGVAIKISSPNEMAKKSVITFALNTFTALGVAMLLQLTNITSVASAAALGIGVSLFFCSAIIAVGGVWESRTVKLMAIDGSYHTCGILVCSIFLSLWR